MIRVIRRGAHAMYKRETRNAKQRDAAEQLGFDEGSWDSDAMVQIDRKKWDELTTVPFKTQTSKPETRDPKPET